MRGHNESTPVILRNESDVREEVAAPLLRLLGYEAGTPNDISREHKLRYDRLQLGRKKENDAKLPQGGSADYLLTVLGAGRWVLETKPPVDVTLDDVEQAISYARHPEVSAKYSAILNGHRFLLRDTNQSSNDPAMLDLPVTSPQTLAAQLQGILGPEAIRRDCTPPIVDLRAPIAKGLRGEAAIIGGWNRHVRNELLTQLPPPIDANMRAIYARIVNAVSAVNGGRVWRDDASRIRAKISWHSPHADLTPALEAVGLNDFEYVCLDPAISEDASLPSVFDLAAAFRLERGQVVYDLFRNSRIVNQMPVNNVIRGQAVGSYAMGKFKGWAEMSVKQFTPFLAYPIETVMETEFEIDIDTR
jgi:hypothetical protein